MVVNTRYRKRLILEKCNFLKKPGQKDWRVLAALGVADRLGTYPDSLILPLIGA